jgi:hypothetical protein
MRALEQSNPTANGVQRKNVRVAVECFTNYVDPPRTFPLIGFCQLHHIHYKCVVDWIEVARAGSARSRAKESFQEVVYIDRDHFHLVNQDKTPTKTARARADETSR